jgi:hypothetical protein
MKIIIVSYSRTGRNHALATSLALELSIEHIKISEEKNRTNYCSSGQAAIPPERSPCLSSCPPSSSVQGYWPAPPVFRVLMVWVYDRTGSLIVAILMHASLTGGVALTSYLWG